MSIEVGKSTSAFMIADPLALLEENEIHLGFSTPFYDSKSKWEDTMLHDVDVLVARLPALLPSDIQKASPSFPALCPFKSSSPPLVAQAIHLSLGFLHTIGSGCLQA